ncbi:hypothetical protein AB3R30_26700 [Leptolyngbyaceae cyanobacterium UHCC 1019]
MTRLGFGIAASYSLRGLRKSHFKSPTTQAFATTALLSPDFVQTIAQLGLQS